ncbi:MAG: glycosyltransferase [Anaerolineaceae bacterium]|nr:glycosyltransferase [Anaerolineaceae bacterium]
MTKKPLILVSNPTLSTPKTLLPFAPRIDYVEFAQTLDADLLGTDGGNPRLRKIEKRIKIDAGQALEAWRRANDYRLVLSLSERIGIPLAMMFQATSKPIPHVLLAHKLSTGRKAQLFQYWKLKNAFSDLICVSSAQVDYAVKKFGFPTDRAHFVYDKVDQKFFIPDNGHEEDYIIAVGQEQRDYVTLAQALKGTNIKLVVVASSLWWGSTVQVEGSTDVKVLSGIPYTELRDLYAKARLAVVPLNDVDYAAGVNGLLESMAMGKPTIITQTKGISDYVVDQQTAIYTPPGNVSQMREHILALWNNAAEQKRLGENARQLVMEKINLDHYVESVQKIIDPIGK